MIRPNKSFPRNAVQYNFGIRTKRTELDSSLHWRRGNKISFTTLTSFPRALRMGCSNPEKVWGWRWRWRDLQQSFQQGFQQRYLAFSNLNCKTVWEAGKQRMIHSKPFFVTSKIRSISKNTDWTAVATWRVSSEKRKVGQLPLKCSNETCISEADHILSENPLLREW